VKRPVSIYLGVLLILLRAVTTVVTAVNVALDWKSAKSSIDEVTAADQAAISSAVLVALMVFFAIAVVIDLVVAVLIVRGSNRARFVAMILATIMVVGSAIDFFADGTSFTLENGGLLGLSLDILVLVALSDSDARDFTTGNSNSRRDARRSGRAARRARRPGSKAKSAA
jgi:glucan phosphoethanolaminetransferase (alkaline phosphatase superfamily)